MQHSHARVDDPVGCHPDLHGGTPASQIKIVIKKRPLVYRPWFQVLTAVLMIILVGIVWRALTA